MKVFDAFVSLVEKACTVLMATMTAVTFAQAFSRYVLNRSIFWTEETAIICMIFITFLGAFVALTKENHTRIDFVLLKFPPKVRKWVEAFNYLLIAALLAFVCYKGYPVAVTQGRFRTPGTHMPRSIYSIPILVGSGLMILYSLLLALRKVMTPVGEKEEQGGEEK